MIIIWIKIVNYDNVSAERIVHVKVPHSIILRCLRLFWIDIMLRMKILPIEWGIVRILLNISCEKSRNQISWLLNRTRHLLTLRRDDIWNRRVLRLTARIVQTQGRFSKLSYYIGALILLCWWLSHNLITFG